MVYMSTKSIPRPAKKAVQLKPKTKALGTVDIKSTRMIFDDSMYPGKFVFGLSTRQLENVREIEGRLDSELTNHAWSSNDFGHQIKVSAEPLERGTYDLQLKVYSWSMGAKNGIGYRVIDAVKVEDLALPERRPLEKLGVCLL